MTSESDAALMARHAEGDAEAFGELVSRHRDRLWAVAVRTLGDREEAADAVQDALVSAFRASAPGGSGGFRGDAAVTTWLHRIVVNACIDRIRRRTARATVPLPDTGAGVPAAPDAMGPRETELVVRDALRLLPAEQAAAIVLVDLQGHPVDEAAAILGVPAGTVKSRCSRGRARLLPLLRDLAPRPGAASDPAAAAVPPDARNPTAAGHVPPGRAEAAPAGPAPTPPTPPTPPTQPTQPTPMPPIAAPTAAEPDPAAPRSTP